MISAWATFFIPGVYMALWAGYVLAAERIYQNNPSEKEIDTANKYISIACKYFKEYIKRKKHAKDGVLVQETDKNAKSRGKHDSAKNGQSNMQDVSTVDRPDRREING